MKCHVHFWHKKASQIPRVMIILMIMFIFMAKVGKSTSNKTDGIVTPSDTNVMKNDADYENDEDFDISEIETTNNPKKRKRIQEQSKKVETYQDSDLVVPDIVERNPSEDLKNKESMLVKGKQYFSIVSIILQLYSGSKAKNIFDTISTYLFQKFDFVDFPDASALQRIIPKNTNAVYIEVSPQFNEKFDRIQDVTFHSRHFSSTNTQYVFLDLVHISNITKMLSVRGTPQDLVKKYYLVVPPTVQKLNFAHVAIKHLDVSTRSESTDIVFSYISNFDLNPIDHRLPKKINRARFMGVEIKSMEFQYDTEIVDLELIWGPEYSTSTVNWKNIYLPSRVEKLTIDVHNYNARQGIKSLFSGISMIKNVQNVQCLHLNASQYRTEEFKDVIETVDFSKFTNLEKLYINSWVKIKNIQWPKTASLEVMLSFKSVSDITLNFDVGSSKIKELNLYDVEITSMTFLPETIISNLSIVHPRLNFINPKNPKHIVLPDTVKLLYFCFHSEDDFNNRNRKLEWIAEIQNLKGVQNLTLELFSIGDAAENEFLEMNLLPFTHLQRLGIIIQSHHITPDYYDFIMPTETTVEVNITNNERNNYVRFSSIFYSSSFYLKLILFNLQTDIFDHFRFKYPCDTKYVDIEVCETISSALWIRMLALIITQNSFQLEELSIRYYAFSESWTDPEVSVLLDLSSLPSVPKFFISFYDPRTEEKYSTAEQETMKLHVQFP